MLESAFAAMKPADGPSPFHRCVPDALPIQRKVIGDYISHLRGMMIRTLENRGIAIPKPRISSLWSFQSALMLARVSVQELAPKYMRGYGDLPDATAQELEALSRQILDVLDQMSIFLSQGGGKDLQARIERLENTGHEVALVKAIEEVVTKHGLVGLRSSVAAVTERLESHVFEIALFGRVSSGKSSLLNHILHTDVLPVGVTPVTAIPTRVVYGARPLARIWLAEVEPIVVETRELAKYVTEQRNPDNVLHVARIEVELTSDRLKDGVTFVDTPGLGSMARYGEMECLAYLPRCDLGIVLIDASSTLIEEDVVIVNALRQAGAEVMVLLTKGDVLDPGERMAALNYVSSQLRANIGFDVPVAVVSVKGADAALCDRWFETAIVPLLREHKKEAAASVRRKVGLLRDATIAALQRRRDQTGGAGNETERKWASVKPILKEALVALEAAIHKCLEWPDLADSIIATASKEMVDEWRGSRARQIDAAAKVISCGSSHVGCLVAEVANSLAAVRDQAMCALRKAAGAAGVHDDEPDISTPSGMPILDLAASLAPTPLHRPLALTLSKGLACRIIRAQLESGVGARLRGLLERYVTQLTQWRSLFLADMRQTLTTKIDFFRVQCEHDREKVDVEAIEKDVQRLNALEGMPLECEGQ